MGEHERKRPDYLDNTKECNFHVAEKRRLLDASFAKPCETRILADSFARTDEKLYEHYESE